MSDVSRKSGIPSTSLAGLPTVPTTTIKRKIKRLEKNRQTKKLIQNVYHFFLKLRCGLVSFCRTRYLTAKACGISKNKLKKIIREFKRNGRFLKPRKSPKKPRFDKNDFNRDIVRRTIFNLYEKRDYPTAGKVRILLINKINYKGSVRSVEHIFRNLGFRFRKCYDGRKFLIERGDIIAKRMEFLRKMNNIRDKTPNKPIFYLDETWFNRNHLQSHYLWQDSNIDGGLKVPLDRSPVFILLHIGSAKTGFIPQCKLLYKYTKSGNHHIEMNDEVFRDWFLNMVNLLDEPSVIVMDNASYHSMESHKAPTINSRKYVIRDWLNEKNISYSPLETKLELIEKVNINKKNKLVYKLDEVAHNAGHEVVRLPPYYHHQYNPIETIWSQIKTTVANMDKTLNINNIEKFTHEAIDNITVEHWKSCVHHAEKMQKMDFEKELYREFQLESIISSIIPEEDDYSDSSDSE